MFSSRCSTQNKFNESFAFFKNFFNLTDPLCILLSSVLWDFYVFLWDSSVWEHLCLCIYMWFLSAFSFVLHLLHPIPLCLLLFCLIYVLLLLDVCLFSKKRQKGCRWRWEKRERSWEETL